MASNTLTQRELAASVDDLKDTETLVDPPEPTSRAGSLLQTLFSPGTFTPVTLPTLPHGDNVLLVIPTANAHKTRMLVAGFAQQNEARGAAASGVQVHAHTVVASSGVGEQPYDDAGVQGARGRINNALRALAADAETTRALLAENRIGTVFVAAIENYIDTGAGADMTTTDANPRPTDYAVVVVHNATTGQSAAGLSGGTTVPRRYFDYARRLGFDDAAAKHGKVTVGEVLAPNVPGIDKANWHIVVAGKSRYDLIAEAIERLQIPW
ncbi:hypothetical protein B0T24DRAFT_601923 [Lasiosphaeria ovina]|uniref:Uncharacterized protein n=1 Tax=Lasiosphaeria ovina TaxID=92902 RepID=A0AAE0NJ84_9PEZI|nr:hypothetical protein B0T24DRAFT_601923 [Lasiosphaeria ovina]